MIIEMRVLDIRFPTARAAVGTDAMHPDPDYSAAYVILEDRQRRSRDTVCTFTIGRGNEVCVAAIHAFREHVVGHDARRDHRRSRRLLADAGGRFATALARS